MDTAQQKKKTHTVAFAITFGVVFGINSFINPLDKKIFTAHNGLIYLAWFISSYLAVLTSYTIVKKHSQPYTQKALTVGCIIGASTGALLVVIFGELIKQLQQ